MSLDKKRKNLELSRVTLAKEEMQFKIEEMKEEIKRLEGYMITQDDKIKILTKEIEG